MNVAELGLEARGLVVQAGERRLVDGVSLSLRAGEIVGLVGPSGSGKSVTMRLLVGMVAVRPGWVAGEVALREGASTRSLRRPADFDGVRGEVVGLLFQDARAALDPLFTVGAQVREAAALAGHPGEEPGPWLQKAGFPDPGRVARCYPHELSGGMAQRAQIAVGLARRSPLLLADEPTTGLDPTVQRAILRQLGALRAEGVGVLFVTHDLRLLPGFADRVLVMEGGRIVEEAPTVAALSGAGRRLVEATRKVAGGAL